MKVKSYIEVVYKYVFILEMCYTGVHVQITQFQYYKYKYLIIM